jgi:predicted adenylyl cyclase CyaB
VVEKHREIYLYRNVRIHLDEVRGLGSFLEFEAVLGPGVDQVAGQSQLDFLAREFSLDRGDLLSGSYSDMVPPGSVS